MSSAGSHLSKHLRPVAVHFALASSFITSLLATAASADSESPTLVRYRNNVQPILETHCYTCHGYGSNEGGRTLDQFESDEAMLANKKLWWAVLQNVRAGVMPPAGEERLSEEERRTLFDWIKFDALAIDRDHPDPGRVTLRRLNRTQYRNTIRDLLGVDYNTSDEFPADDSGYGFDNVADVLSVSPLLMEKYLDAAEMIVERAVPTEAPHPKDSHRQKKYKRVFRDGPPPKDAEQRDAYARSLLANFTRRAYRRPVDGQVIDRLVQIAKDVYTAPGQTFESGIANAMAAVLASPRFIFLIEDIAPSSSDEKYPLIDEHALASRLSYFLWSTMPDRELIELADRGELRANLTAQIKRMVKDDRITELAENFAGQWLRSRDVERFEVDLMFGHDLAVAMAEETNRYFEHIVRKNRSVLELIDSDYTFLNERLAAHYGIEGVDGRRIRRVELPADSPRGGVLTQGAMLVVTSNPVRTSPVKRGLFILENILGTPPPPPPPNLPLLEDSASAISGHTPTVRELQEQHRKDPLCHSCHSRMDPLGLAFENFDRLGKWRTEEGDQPVDPSGTLLTGEHFDNVGQLKKIMKEERRQDFYRCLTEKLLTYAIARGLDYHDEYTIDQIVERLDNNQGRFAELLTGVVESAPFQRQRRSE